jgi:hypothetical protein
MRAEANDVRERLAATRLQLETARKQLSALIEEARRLDVPPGWLR